MPYASRTGTRSTIEKMRIHGWRILVVAGSGNIRSEGLPYALDNGAWSYHLRGQPFDEVAFGSAVDKVGAGADWIALPDIVAGGLPSLELSRSWLSRLEGVAPLLIPVQDGMRPAGLGGFDLGPSLGLFVGGSTDWKWNHIGEWSSLARARRCHIHVARVNSTRRIRQCTRNAVDSFDGTSVTRYSKTIVKLDAARRQLALIGDE